MHEDIPTTGYKGTKIWELREHKRKAEWINNMEKELKGFEEGLKAKIYLKSQRATHKNYQIRKFQVIILRRSRYT